MECDVLQDKTLQGLLKQISKMFDQEPSFQTEDEVLEFLEERNQEADEQIFIGFHVLDVD